MLFGPKGIINLQTLQLTVDEDALLSYTNFNDFRKHWNNHNIGQALIFFSDINIIKSKQWNIFLKAIIPSSFYFQRFSGIENTSEVNHPNFHHFTGKLTESLGVRLVQGHTTISNLQRCFAFIAPNKIFISSKAKTSGCDYSEPAPTLHSASTHQVVLKFAFKRWTQFLFINNQNPT